MADSSTPSSNTPASSTGTRALAGMAALPLLTVTTVLVVLGGAGASAYPASTECGAGGTGQTIAGAVLDAGQIGNAATIVAVTANRQLPAAAAVIAVATAYTESKLRNTTTQTDHDSLGLFQQRVSIYTAAVAADPVRATNAFLDRLTAIPNWQTTPVGAAAQAVQSSAYPGRYEPNAALARQLVGQFWAAAAADATAAEGAGSAPPTPVIPSGPDPAPAAPTVSVPAICAGAGGANPGGGAGGNIVGPHGNNVAGTTTVPADLMLTGSAAGQVAVRYALAQLGKPYVWAAAGPNAFDCSGLTMAAWAAAGVALPHSAAAQTGSGSSEPTNLSGAVGGDLVMIPGADGTPTRPGHVGMVAGYVDAPDGRHLYLIQAPMSGIPVELTEATRWAGQIIAVRHIR